MSIKLNRCCICGAPIAGDGHAPQPVKEQGVCCSACNYKIVIPAQIKLSTEREQYNLQQEIAETMADDIGF